MKKITSNKVTDCAAVYSDCVSFSGVDIPCLGIKQGDCMTSVMEVIAAKVCQLAEPLDLSEVSLQCIVDKLQIEEPAQKTLNNILSVIITSTCTLKDLIDALAAQNAEAPLILDLGCLTIYDSFGNALPYTLETVLQTLLTEACVTKGLVSELGGIVSDLQNQINNINPDPYTEPTLSSCIYTNKPTSQALQLLAGDYCNYKDVIGQGPALQAAVGLQPSEITSYYTGLETFVAAPITVADMLNNMQVIIKDLFNRLFAAEVCCLGSCDSIKIGFEVETNEDKTRITLIYSEVMGTSIPSGWVDEGSVLTITDSAKRERKFFNLNVGQNLESPELDISGFMVNDPLELCLEVRLRNTLTDELCVKCVCRTFMITDDSCPVCKVTAVGNTGAITIVYQEI